MKKHHALLLCICILAARFLCAQSTPVPCEKLPPRPTTAVADLAGYMNPADRDMLERQLREYWNNTSIAIVVVTVPTLQGYDQFDYSLSLFNCWGAGDKNLNHGILIMVAKAERKISVRTSAHIEFLITDNDARAIREAMTPLAKAGDMTGGIRAGVDKAIQIAGTMSWQDRIAEQNRAKAKAEQESAETWAFIMNVTYVVLGILLLFMLFLLLRNWARRARIRKAVMDRINQIEAEISKAKELVRASREGYKQYPAWVIREGEAHMQEVLDAVTGATQHIDAAHDAISENISTQHVNHHLLTADQMLQLAFKSFTKADNDLKKKADDIARQAPLRVAEAKKEISDAISGLTGYIAKGFRFSSELNNQKDLLALAAELAVSALEPEKQLDAYQQSRLLMEQSRAGIIEVEKTVQRSIEISKKLPAFKNFAGELYKKLVTYQEKIDKSKHLYPPTVWQKYETVIQKAAMSFDPDRMNMTIAQIDSLNSMEQQKFQAADEKYQRIEEMMKHINKTFSDIDLMHEEQTQARKSYGTALSKAEQAVKQSLKAIKKTDASDEAKQTAKNASNKLSAAKLSGNKSIVDWVSLVALLASIKDAAEDAIERVTADVQEAQEERQREIQRELDRKNKSRYQSSSRRDDYSYNNTPVFTTYNSPSVDTTSSFGGFGGGFSGGGGSDGGF